MPTDEVLCTICGSVMAALSEVSVGDTVGCDDCGREYEIQGPPETRVQKYVACTECGEAVEGGKATRITDRDEAGRPTETRDILFSGTEDIVSGDLVDCPDCGEEFVADLRDSIVTEEVKIDHDATDEYDYLRTVPVGDA